MSKIKCPGIYDRQDGYRGRYKLLYLGTVTDGEKIGKGYYVYTQIGKDDLGGLNGRFWLKTPKGWSEEIHGDTSVKRFELAKVCFNCKYSEEKYRIPQGRYLSCNFDPEDTCKKVEELYTCNNFDVEDKYKEINND